MIHGSRFSKYFSASVMIQAVQNDDDVLKSRCSINLYFCPLYDVLCLNNCSKLCVTRIQRLPAAGEKEEINQVKLAGLRVHISIRLHGVLKQTFKL